MNKGYPVLADQDADAILKRSGQYGFRCFFGVHSWAYHGWPLYARRTISMHTICVRCGELKWIDLVEP